MKARSKKAKGIKLENKIAKMFETLPFISAQRVPASGAFQSWPGDVDVYVDRGDRRVHYRAECKKRANGGGFVVLDRWRGDNSFLFLEEDRGTPKVYMEVSDFLEFVETVYEAGENNGRCNSVQTENGEGEPDSTTGRRVQQDSDNAKQTDG